MASRERIKPGLGSRLTVCLLVWAGGWAGSLSAQPANSDTGTETGAQIQEVISVTTRPLEAVWFDLTHQVSAEVVSLNHPQISAQATGEVLSINVEVGDRVEKDAVMVSLDCRQSELNLAVIEDAYELARQEFQRSQSLQKNNAIAEQQFSQATSTLAQAEIRKQQAALAVEHCRISAPFTGVVTERQVQLGAVVVPGTPIMKLLQTDAVEVSVRLTRDELLSMQEANAVFFSTGGRSYPLRPRAVLPLVDSISNKRTVRLSIDGEAPFPGEPGDVVWQAQGKYMPVGLLVQRGGELGYFVDRQGVARFIRLEDAELGHPARIGAADVDAGETRVVVEGRFRVEDGSRIKALSGD